MSRIRLNIWHNTIQNNKLQLLVSVVGTIASVAGLMQFLTGMWELLILIVPVVALLLITIMVLLNFGSTRAIFRVDDEHGIRDYMFRWIKNGGRVAIWTRDMSWVNDDEMKQLLQYKARVGELIVCLPKATEATESLRDHGAEVYTYGIWDSPLGRFTISNFNRENARVAVGIGVGQLHVIDEYSRNDNDSTFCLAHDLVRLVRGSPVQG